MRAKNWRSIVSQIRSPRNVCADSESPGSHAGAELLSIRVTAVCNRHTHVTIIAERSAILVEGQTMRILKVLVNLSIATS